MPGPRIKPVQVDKYWDERASGESMRTACARAGFSLSHALKLEKARQERGPSDEKGRQRELKDPLTLPELSDEAKRALKDFGYFQTRYFGRIPYYWQIEAAEQAIEWLASPDKEYAVVNCPPAWARRPCSLTTSPPGSR